MSELKPCPFCGGEAFMGGYDAYSCDSSFDAIECAKCGALSAPCDTGDELDQAAKDWNTRPPMQDCAKEMYALLERLYKESALVYGDDYDAVEKLLAKARGESCD